MQRIPILPLVFLVALASAAAKNAWQHPSSVSKVLATYTPASVADHSPRTMAAAGITFLEALDEELCAQAALPIDSAERQRWTNVPPSGEVGGVRLGDCNDDQVQRACDLLAAVLSQQGYEKMRGILLADDRLLRGGQPRPGFGAENYWLAIFGTPSDTDPWALQLDGHHVALNLTLHGDKMTMSPSFIGTQPSAFELDGKEIVPLRGEVDDAFALVNSLTEEQKEKAILTTRRGRVAAGAGKDGFVPEPVGLACSALDESQRALLASLLGQYVGDLPEPYAERRLRVLLSGIDGMRFAWSGPTENPSDVSYRVQGPALIVEYACQDLGGDPLDHLHSMYRDPTNEYGARLANYR